MVFRVERLERICRRSSCLCSFRGRVSGDWGTQSEGLKPKFEAAGGFRSTNDVIRGRRECQADKKGHMSTLQHDDV